MVPTDASTVSLANTRGKRPRTAPPSSAAAACCTLSPRHKRLRAAPPSPAPDSGTHEWAARNLRFLRELAARHDAARATVYVTQAARGVTPRHRGAAVAYMLSEALKFSIAPDSVHLAIALLDGFMGAPATTLPPATVAQQARCKEGGAAALEDAQRTVLRRLGATCLILATKVRETTFMSPRNVVKQLRAQEGGADASNTLAAVRSWEVAVAAHFGFALERATALAWVQYGAALLAASPAALALAHYLLDLAADDVVVAAAPPERHAWATLWLAMLRVYVATQYGVAASADLDLEDFATAVVAAAPHDADTSLVLLPCDVRDELAHMIRCVLPRHTTLSMRNAVWRAHAAGGDWACASLTKVLGGCGAPEIDTLTAVTLVLE